MNVISKKLSLVLAEYDELPNNIQKNIDHYKKEKCVFRMKGDLRLFEANNKYLYVTSDLFDNSLLRIIYGDRIYRTNEDSFDTLLYDYFKWFAYINGKLTEMELVSYVKGLEIYALNNSIENLWHLLQITKQCIENSFHPNFGSLLSFYSIIELLIIDDTNNKKSKKSIVKECKEKLPYFYKRISDIEFPEKYYLNHDLSEKEVFENLTRLRHKVIHGIFSEARCILDILFPNKITCTEDAESSAFQDQIKNLNGLLRNELGQILREWMIDPQKLDTIKNNLDFEG